MLLNISNHPSSQWPESQMKMAIQQYGSVVDLPFPPVDPVGDVAYIENLADEYLQICINMLGGSDNHESMAVHIMGELTFSFALVHRLQREGFMCIASTTSRMSQENGKGEKVSLFSFVKFRPYLSLLNP